MTVHFDRAIDFEKCLVYKDIYELLKQEKRPVLGDPYLVLDPPPPPAGTLKLRGGFPIYTNVDTLLV